MGASVYDRMLMDGGYGMPYGVAGGGRGGKATPWSLMLPNLALGGGAQLMNLIAGNPYEKYNKAGLNYAKQNLGKDPLNVPNMIARARSAGYARMPEMAEDIDRKLGLDTGRGAQALAREWMGMESDSVYNAMMKNAQLKSQRDQVFANMLAGAGGGY